jgi:hypothetical protein
MAGGSKADGMVLGILAGLLVLFSLNSETENGGNSGQGSPKVKYINPLLDVDYDGN